MIENVKVKQERLERKREKEVYAVREKLEDLRGLQQVFKNNIWYHTWKWINEVKCIQMHNHTYTYTHTDWLTYVAFLQSTDNETETPPSQLRSKEKNPL